MAPRASASNPAARFVQVNVYYAGGRWQVTAMLRQPGGPHPKTLAQLGRWEVGVECKSLEEAVAAAGLVLSEVGQLPL